jgi:hypothetical protein
MSTYKLWQGQLEGFSPFNTMESLCKKVTSRKGKKMERNVDENYFQQCIQLMEYQSRNKNISARCWV